MRLAPERHSEGASAVEFVFILPLLVVLVFGIIQFGLAYNRSQGMHAAAREGARLASIGASDGEITNRVQAALGGTTVDPDDTTTVIRGYLEGDDPNDDGSATPYGGAGPCDPPSPAHTVRVAVEVTGNLPRYAITIPLLPSWPQTFPSEAIFRCEDRT